MLRLFSTYLRSVTARLVTISIVLSMLVLPRESPAAVNTATDPGGGSVTLASSGPVTVNAVTLALVKQARDLGGTVLPGGTNVSSGQVIYFVLYVDNTTPVSALNLRLTDLLNEAQFTYVPNSLETTTVPTGSNDAAIWGGVWASLTDGVGGPDDIASITDTGGPAGLDRVTIGAVPGQANQNLDIPASMLRAVRFQVTVN